MKNKTEFQGLDNYINESAKIDEGMLDYAKSLGKQVGSGIANKSKQIGSNIANKGKEMGQNISQKGKQVVDKGKSLHNQAKAESQKQDLVNKIKKEYAAYREHFSEANKLKASIAKDKKVLAQNYNMSLEDLGIQTGRKK